jgi:DNA-binding MltR family transcriptional regulator
MPDTNGSTEKLDVGEANAFLQELLRESDRGRALVGCAFLDDMVEKLCRAKMVTDAKAVDNLLEYPGPLTSFAARTDLAYALGWIGAQMYQDLRRIHKIRNAFAHSSCARGFDDADVRSLCEGLEVVKSESRFNVSRTGDKFILAVVFLILQLADLVGRAVRPVSPGDPPIRPITEWLPGAERKRLGVEV